MDSSIYKGVKTVRDDNNEIARIPETGVTDRPEQRGFSPRESIYVWILTTWQSSKALASHLTDKHVYTHTKSEKMETEMEGVLMYHAGFVIVGGNHVVKSIGRGPWRILAQMKVARPDHRFWVAAVSGTITSSDPEDIVGPMDI